MKKQMENEKLRWRFIPTAFRAVMLLRTSRSGENFMDQLHQEIADFAAERREERLRASQNAAFFIISGIELSAALVATGKERQRVVRRIERLLERERLKGARLHWSYDLNRHIALKQALDRLRGLPLAPAKRTTCDDRWKQRRRPKAPQCSSSDPQVAGPGFRTAANAT